MNEYSISDYGIFNDAVSSINALNDSLASGQESIMECKANLNKESVFMGPICDSCMEGFSDVDSKISTMTDDFSTIESYLIETASNYQKGDKDAADKVLPLSDTSTTTSNGSLVMDGNVINTSTPVTTGNKYNLSNDDLSYLAYVAMREQGSVGGAKLELSLMANLYEKNKNKYSNVKDYVDNSGWFASSSRSGYQYPGDDYYNAAKEVLNGGNRYLNSNVVEHDCLSDISSISTGSVRNRSDYVPDETVIHNVYGSDYVFVGFAPNDGDPFGYIV